MAYGTLGADYFQNSAGVTSSSAPPAFRNRLINGAMQVWQRATASTTVTAGTAVPTASAGYYTADRWFIYSVGANATAARTTGSNGSQYSLQITGAASITNIGVGQRIEAANSYDLAGDTVTLSVQMANSLLTTVNWTVNYANSTDTFGTIGTATKTLISNGSWTVNSTMTTYTATFTIPAAATTGLEVLFTVGSQTSGTWTIGQAQLEVGSYNTSFDYRSIGTELALCQRYYYKVFPANSSAPFGVGQAFGTTSMGFQTTYPVTLRAVPTALEQNGTATHYAVLNSTGVTTLCSSVPAFNAATNTQTAWTNFAVASGLTAGNAATAWTNNATAYLAWSVELP